jgi:hypothetical protein
MTSPIPGFGIPRRIAAIGLAAALVALACGEAASLAPTTVAPSETAASAIRPILATKELRIGTQRFSLLLAGETSLIKAPEALVATTYPGSNEEPGEVKRAGFHLWPYGVRGSYTTDLNFDRAGPWRVDITVDTPSGPKHTDLMVDVAERSGVVDIGEVPPFGLNKTVRTVSSLKELTSDYTPDPDLYQLTVAEAAITGVPSVIVFATPAFCTSPTCGPQVDTLSELKDLHKQEANFIHIELYANPEIIQGDLSKAVLDDLVHQWGLSSIPDWFNESWTFVIGTDGRIAQRFEGFATLEELEQALRQAMTQT